MKPMKPSLILLLVLLWPTFVPADATTPPQVVETLHTTLIDAMKRADQLGFSGRYDVLRPVLNDSFDFETIAFEVSVFDTMNGHQSEGFYALLRMPA